MILMSSWLRTSLTGAKWRLVVSHDKIFRESLDKASANPPPRKRRHQDFWNELLLFGKHLHISGSDVISQYLSQPLSILQHSSQIIIISIFFSFRRMLQKWLNFSYYYLNITKHNYATHFFCQLSTEIGAETCQSTPSPPPPFLALSLLLFIIKGAFFQPTIKNWQGMAKDCNLERRLGTSQGWREGLR